MVQIELKPGWLKRQVDKAAEDVARMPLWMSRIEESIVQRKSPMPLEQVAAIKAEADRRYKDNPKSAYGSAHVVAALCARVQELTAQVNRLKRKQQHAQQH